MQAVLKSVLAFMVHWNCFERQHWIFQNKQTKKPKKQTTKNPQPKHNSPKTKTHII